MARLVAVLVAGWLPVMTGTTQTLALRMRDVGDPSSWAAEYSVVTAVGWLVSIVALVAAGVVHDRAVRRAVAATPGGADGAPVSPTAPLPRWIAAAPVLLVAAAAVVATADGVAGVALGWLALQVPTAALVTVAAARLADATPPGRRWAAAALTGSGPGLGLALGSAVVAVTGPTALPSVLLPALLAAGLVVPALRRGDLAARPAPSPAPAAAARTARRGLVVLLVAVALADGGLSTGLIYAVPAVERALALPLTEVAALTSRLVLLATLLTLVGNLAGGALARWRGGATVGFVASAAALAAALALLVTTRTGSGLAAAFAVAGLAAGVSNGTTFALYLDTAVDGGAHGRGLGWLNAVPTVPFVLVPALAAPLLRGDVDAGIGTVLRGGAVAAGAAALLAATAGRRIWRRAAAAATVAGPLSAPPAPRS